MTIRVRLLDDHPSLLDSLRNLLRDADDVTVVVRCASDNDALAALLDRGADVIVLDLPGPVMDRLAALGARDEGRPGVRVVVLTRSLPQADLPEAIRLGITAIVDAHDTESESRSPLESSTADQPSQRPSMTDPQSGGGRRESTSGFIATAGLTARELDIVRAIADGLRNRAIAEKLRVTEGTVKVHLHNIYRKLGLGSRLALMLYTQEHGLV
jgi:DNA-binding NarL/FixJ family response regulator